MNTKVSELAKDKLVALGWICQWIEIRFLVLKRVTFQIHFFQERKSRKISSQLWQAAPDFLYLH